MKLNDDLKGTCMTLVIMAHPYALNGNAYSTFQVHNKDGANNLS